MIKTDIIFCMQPITLVCDGKCDEAWGNNWAGDRVAPAPEDPGTYEGGEGKPIDKKHNKWCARECERSELIDR